jgi:LAS superfamily LD-carboxypeptidase LdcB
LIKNTFFLIILFISIVSCKDDTKGTGDLVSEPSTSKNQAAVIDTIGIDFIMGRFNPALDSSFVLIEPKYADREGMYMKKAAYLSFINMWEAAKAAGIDLVIRSAARNFDYQKSIWEKKWTGKTLLSDGSNALKDYGNSKDRALKILEYSSMPGTSRHHWGTDIDLNNFNNSWFESGKGLELFNWLTQNAASFGYCRPYTKKDAVRQNGYNEEKWHWSYMPLSKVYTKYAEENLKNEAIDGFLGSSVNEEINIVTNYVLGISQECR